MGPRGSKVKAMVNIWSLVGEGFKETNISGCGPPGCSENHHQMVVVGGGAVQQGTQLSLQLSLWECGALK